MIKQLINKNKQLVFQFWKYAVVGGFNFAISLGLYILLIKHFKTNYLLAYVLTWLFGMLLTYALNFLWVFKVSNKIVVKKFLPKYIVIYGSSFLLNLFMLKHLVENKNLDPMLTQFFLIPLVVLYNFAGMKFWSFKN